MNRLANPVQFDAEMMYGQNGFWTVLSDLVQTQGVRDKTGSYINHFEVGLANKAFNRISGKDGGALAVRRFVRTETHGPQRLYTVVATSPANAFGFSRQHSSDFSKVSNSDAILIVQDPAKSSLRNEVDNFRLALVSCVDDLTADGLEGLDDTRELLVTGVEET